MPSACVAARSAPCDYMYVNVNVVLLLFARGYCGNSRVIGTLTRHYTLQRQLRVRIRIRIRIYSSIRVPLIGSGERRGE